MAEKDKKSKKIIPWLLCGLGGVGLVTGIALISVGVTTKPTPEQDTRPVVTFNLDGAYIISGSNSIKVEPNTEFGLISKPNFDTNGKIFDGWYKDAEKTIRIDDTEKISTSMTVYLKLVDDTTPYLTFVPGDSGATLSGVTKVAIGNKQFSEINKPIAKWTSSTKKFRAWLNGGFDVTDTQTFPHSTTITPDYTEKIESIAHVTYKIKPTDSGHFEGLYDYNVASGTIFQTTTKPKPVWEGRIFNKWVMSDGAGGYKDVPANYQLPEGDNEFYADFEQVDIYEKISINVSGTTYWLSNETDTTGDLVFINDSGTKKTFKRDEFNEEITIGQNKKAIDINFLFNCSAFNNGGTKLVIPSSVTEIGAAFMHNCKAFNQEIDLSACTGLTTIGNSFLQKCENFNSAITFPTSVPNDFYIGNYFLFECTKFNQTINLPSNMEVIAGSFLEGCTAFNQKLVLPTSLTAINSYFLARCISFNQELSVPNTVTHIAEDFLYNCSAFNSKLTLSNQLTTIEDAFMTGCSSFNDSSFAIPTSITKIKDYFMYSCEKFNQVITLPTSLTSIGVYFLGRCYNFNQSFTMHENIESVGEGFLYYCSDMIATITINCNYQNFVSSEYTLSTGSPHSACYTTGITISGDYKTNFVSSFSGRSSIPYRKLIVG